MGFGCTTTGCSANGGSTTTRSTNGCRWYYQSTANCTIASTANGCSTIATISATVFYANEFYSATSCCSVTTTISINGTNSAISACAIYAIWTSVCIHLCWICLHSSTKRFDCVSANGGCI